MKKVFVFLAIVGCAFCFAARMHSPPALATPANSPDWLNGLAARLTPKFDLRDIHPGCYEDSTALFRASSACVARISASDTRFRFLKLHLEQGAKVTVLFTPLTDDSGITYRPLTLLLGQSQTLVLPAAGGGITLSCVGAGACSVHAE